MSRDTAHMPLDGRGLEAARDQPGTNHDGIIRAYLQTAAADVSGMVERLGHSAAFAFPVVQEAASTLGAQAAELAAVKTKASYWQAEYLNACRDAAGFSDDLLRAETRLAEALKALEPFAAVAEHDIGDDETDDDIFWPISNARYSMSGRLRVGHLRAARRVREGGKVDAP